MGRTPKENLPLGFSDLLITVGSNIREKRVKLGISQSELAKRAKISATTLNEIETKSHRDIRLSTLHAFASVLRIPLVSFFLKSDLDSLLPTDRRQLLKASEDILRITRKIQAPSKTKI